MLPESWNDILAAPAFLISVDRTRYDICERRATRAGFTQVCFAPGIPREDRAMLEENWKKHTFLPHHEIFGQHPAAVMLAHLNVWKQIMERGLPYAVVFEDDLMFHTRWHELAPEYYKATPKSTDMIFMGHHCGNVYSNMHIAQVPVYCLNAYVVTLEGVRKLYQMITQYPYSDFGVIDMMLARLQMEYLRPNANHLQFQWYAWNTHMFPDKEQEAYKHPGAVMKDMGLVFQQYPVFELEHEKM